MSKDEARIVCGWIKELRMLDGYSFNLSRCANVQNGTIQGLKSHVLMETFILLAFSCLLMHVLNQLIEMNNFFKDLCYTTLKENSLRKLEENIPIILSKLERIFPYAFFNSMKHLPVHLAYEAWLGRPVQYRWMYPFERFMGEPKRLVKNKARVEGSTCVAYLHRETTYFCSHYFKNFMLSPTNVRNEMQLQVEPCQGKLSVFRQSSCHAGKEFTHWLTNAEFNSAHVHFLINCSEVKLYLDYVIIQLLPLQWLNCYTLIHFIHTISFLVVEQVVEGNAFARIHSEFPQWFRYQLCFFPYVLSKVN
ncbi:uncharacterized protein LOC128196306 [Vigna angularis]|uniref:uncharacterized protein LOC128196306 n=1 Tax=Phaseolus angularis TaxID=3914 RepID=UPI0022B549BE|nr:uncharacterized protein LOC128196306 [Vigna angularis]XP_052732655.1 uncharacterized protein LOC128196306 [Vigna angularis]XP_052732656.1 uncharacterized protein LOC128196306 [Vigna angularis]XP_052732657.1 uncharacterized protein LOC128196306 [Vigna angularis]XP_052732658.1 uncharacterized protein LOC128196306 [Vigna angularis]